MKNFKQRFLFPLLFFFLLILITVAIIESARFFGGPLVSIENFVGRTILPNNVLSYVLDLKQYIIYDQRRGRRIRTDKFIPFGDDPLCFVREPGWTVNFKYGSDGPILSQSVDETGFLNANIGFYRAHDQIDIFVAGDSVIQGIGQYSAFEGLKELDLSLWILATGSYSPHQKVQSLQHWAFKKHPRWIVLEFFGGNDVTEMIEDTLLQKHSLNYQARFHRKTLRRLVSTTSPYNQYVKLPKGPKQWLRSHSICYNILGNAKMFLIKMRQQSQVNDNANPLQQIRLCKPGSTLFPLKPEHRLDWVRSGMSLTLEAYHNLLKSIDAQQTQLIILYNPAAYEVYRPFLPVSRVDTTADAISFYQRQELQNFCDANGIIFRDLTYAFQEAAAHDPYLYGENEGTHWSPSGTKVATRILREVLLPVILKGQRPNP